MSISITHRSIILKTSTSNQACSGTTTSSLLKVSKAWTLAVRLSRGFASFISLSDTTPAPPTPLIVYIIPVLIRCFILWRAAFSSMGERRLVFLEHCINYHHILRYPDCAVGTHIHIPGVRLDDVTWPHLLCTSR